MEDLELTDYSIEELVKMREELQEELDELDEVLDEKIKQRNEDVD